MAAYAGFFAQVPLLTSEWRLSAADTGWISGAFYGGYMLAVPILVTLTDYMDPRRIYLVSMMGSALGALGFALLSNGMGSAVLFHALMGAGLAGTYMPGLRLLTDRLDGTARSRAVALYTGTYAVGTAASFVLIGQLSRHFGWQWAFGLAAAGPILATITIAASVRPARRPRKAAGGRAEAILLDLRLVVSNRAAMARSIAYAAHNFELFGLWSWAVAFLNFAYAQRPTDGMQIDATIVTAGLALMLLPASVGGNELAALIGSRRWIIGVMVGSALIASTIGFLAGAIPTGILIAVCMLYGIATAAESGALTASVIAVSDDRYRGMTMAVYSMVGFAGSCAGPLVFGLTLEYFGPARDVGWGAAFVAMGLGALIGPLALFLLDRQHREVPLRGL